MPARPRCALCSRKPEGFPLIGGRVDRVHGNAVATLTYSRDNHLIDVFVLPAEGQAILTQHATQRGFNLLRWVDDSMQLWAVSDLERNELEHFAQLWQAHATKQ
jgi:anti-sigma factor RsiW